MNSKLFHTIRHTLIVDEEFLRRLVSLMERKFSKVKLEIECSDHSEKTAINVDELIAYDNAHHHRIKVITITGSSYEKSEFCTVRIKAAPLWHNAFVSVEAEEAIAEAIKSEILNILKVARVPGMKEWLYFTTPYNVSGALSIPMLLVWITLSIMALGQSKDKSGLNLIDIFLCVIIGGAVETILEFFYSMLYPRIFFALGLQKKNLDTLHTWQNIVWTVVILGAILGIGVNYISSKLGL